MKCYHAHNIIRLTQANVWESGNGEALQLHAVDEKPYSLLQVTQESISGITSHVCKRLT